MTAGVLAPSPRRHPRNAGGRSARAALCRGDQPFVTRPLDFPFSARFPGYDSDIPLCKRGPPLPRSLLRHVSLPSASTLAPPPLLLRVVDERRKTEEVVLRASRRIKALVCWRKESRAVLARDTKLLLLWRNAEYTSIAQWEINF